MSLIKISLACFILFVIAIWAAILWTSSWAIDDRPTRPKEPRKMTDREIDRMLEIVEEQIEESEGEG